MKVFIVIARSDNDSLIIGTYSTLNKAEKAAIDTANYQSQFGYHYIKEVDRYDDGDMIGWYDYNNNRSIFILQSTLE